MLNLIPAAEWLHNIDSMLCCECHMFSVVVTYNIFPSRCVITYTCISESEIKTKKCVSQTAIVLHLLFLSNQGVEANCHWEETGSLCYPTGCIHVLLTQEWMTRVGNSKVLSVSFPAICQVYCGHDSSWRAEAEMDPQLRAIPQPRNQKDQGPHL